MLSPLEAARRALSAIRDDSPDSNIDWVIDKFYLETDEFFIFTPNDKKFILGNNEDAMLSTGFIVVDKLNENVNFSTPSEISQMRAVQKSLAKVIS